MKLNLHINGNDRFFQGQPKLGQVISIKRNQLNEVEIKLIGFNFEETTLSFNDKLDYFIYFDFLNNNFIRSKMIYKEDSTNQYVLMYVLTKKILQKVK